MYFSDLQHGEDTKLTCVLFDQFGDVFLVENILFGGHPVSQQENDQDSDCAEQDQL